MALWRFGEDPLTWCFVKLFGFHVCRFLVEYADIPYSHAWPIYEKNEIVARRMLTKAQVCGMVVSIYYRAERVEFQIDDGTELIPCVLWQSQLTKIPMELGNLVHFEGKLQWNRNDRPHVELRVIRYRVLSYPNEEMFYWLHVMQLCSTSYSSLKHVPITGESKKERKTLSSMVLTETNGWEFIAAMAFFTLQIPELTAQNLCAKEWTIQVLRYVLVKQIEEAPKPAQLTFVQIVQEMTSKIATPQETQQLIMLLRKSFAELREIGLLYLADPERDIYVFQSYLYNLKPAILSCLQNHEGGQLYLEIAESILSLKQFRRISLDWLGYAVHKMEDDGIIVEEQRRFREKHQSTL